MLVHSFLLTPVENSMAISQSAITFGADNHGPHITLFLNIEFLKITVSIL